MSPKKTLASNLKLSNKLLDFISSNPHVTKSHENNVSYVIFSESDDELNKENKKLVESLQKKGRKVVKATHKSGGTPGWKFTPLY